MVTVTRNAGSVTQTTGTQYAQFENLNILMTEFYTFTDTIQGKNSSPNRPSTVSLTDFGFNIPSTAEINKITIKYSDVKIVNITISAPTITLLGVNGFSKTTVAPVYNPNPISHNVVWDNPNITASQINSENFGVQINYPANTSDNSGQMGLGDITITVDYTPSEYTVQLKKVNGGYNEDPYVLEASISNINLTSYNPTVRITNPTGFVFRQGAGTGSWTSNGNVVNWNPQLNRNTGTSTCRLTYNTNVTFPDEDTAYTGTFTMRETLNNTTTNHNAIILHRPSDEGSETGTETATVTENAIANLTLLKPIVNDEIPVTVQLQGVAFTFPMNGENQPILTNEDTPVKYYLAAERQWIDGTTYDSDDYEAYPSGDDYYNKFKFTTPGRYITKVYEDIDDTHYSSYEDETPIAIILFDVLPVQNTLTTPNLTILTLTSEELNRLGDGYSYICETYLEAETTDTYIRDWYTNNRIGVFNNAIEGVSDYSTLTAEQIYNNTSNWSNAVDDVNEYGNIEAEFTYDEDYPLYILVTGDFDEAETYGFTKAKIHFMEPSIIEKVVYNGREETGIYFEPILQLLDGNNVANMTVPVGASSSGVRLYGFPSTSSYNKEYAIRGITVTGEVSNADPLVLYAQINKPDGTIGSRSIILDDNDDFKIGGNGDLWGFKITTLQDLGAWELELSTSNIVNNSPSNLTCRNISAEFYIEEVQAQNIEVYVDDEALSYYGAFIEDINIPEGLKTDTSYITIDGTDMNDAYRQNIREKTITLTFSIGECDLETSTTLLRQLTKLLVNEKDQYNRPIPKQVRFSHYPSEYYEYILEDTLDITTEVTGYTVKANLVIPAGTSYQIEDTVTNTFGSASGLAPVNPIITMQPSDSNIEIQETITGQTFTMGYTGDWNNSIIEIDCNNRKVHMITEEDTIDISKYVDHNSDWFRLQGEYQFEGVNCIIRTVTFNERW